MRKLVYLVFTLALVLCLSGYLFYQRQMHRTLGISKNIEVPKGTSFYTAIKNIVGESSTLTAAKIYLKINSLTYSLKPGEYEINKKDSLSSLIKKMSEGKVIVYKITIPEGYNIFEIAQLLEKKSILKNSKTFTQLALNSSAKYPELKIPVKSLEGYLYPSTYELSKNMREQDLIKTFVTAFKNYLNENLKEANTSKDQIDLHSLVTLASIVEKETGAPWERPLISSVFHNRLKKGMRLQSDPTTIYGQWVKTGERLFNIRKSHLLEKNDYNTYKISKLPVGPIANPGREAIKAALQPESSKYLYFVSKNDGTHTFSKSYAEHNRAVRKFQMSRKAREGKSWRNLKKD